MSVGKASGRTVPGRRTRVAILRAVFVFETEKLHDYRIAAARQRRAVAFSQNEFRRYNAWIDTLLHQLVKALAEIVYTSLRYWDGANS
jgi:hypothetical protein